MRYTSPTSFAAVALGLAAGAQASASSGSSWGSGSSARVGLGGAHALKPDSKVARNVLEGKAEGYCSPSGPIESTHCLYETVETLNHALFPAVHDLVESAFFRHYKVDLYRECPFWYENGFCMNRQCGVQEADESEIPEKWRAQALSEVKVYENDDEGISSCYFKEQDFCYVEDDADQNGQYVDLTLNPERFTGYAGDSAHNVWRAIYEENCFGLSEASVSEASKASVKGASEGLASAVIGAGGISKPAQSAGLGGQAGEAGQGMTSGWGFSKLSEGWGTEMVKAPLDGEDEMCEEKRVYYRVISGLHASISIHICADYLNQTTGEWAPDLNCFIHRLATHPERLSNVYFNAVLLIRAVARAAPYLRAYDIGTSPTGVLRESDLAAKTKLEQVLSLATGEEMSKGFDEGDFFTGPDAVILKEQFKTHFRNVSRIMDCVGCDKCRLWGKLQVTGIGTALKILFELDDKALDPKINPDLLQRSEVVALFNTLHRISESLAAVEQFRRMYAETQVAEANAKAGDSDKHRGNKGKGKKQKSIQGKEDLKALPPAASTSLSSIVALLASSFEAVRRSCRGCLELCWGSLQWVSGGKRWLSGIAAGGEL